MGRLIGTSPTWDAALRYVKAKIDSAGVASCVAPLDSVLVSVHEGGSTMVFSKPFWEVLIKPVMLPFLSLPQEHCSLLRGCHG